MNRRARLEATLTGARPDRTPVALWRHFPVDDQTPEGLAAAVVAFQQAYDFDFVKVTPESSYFIKEWGITDAWRGNPEGTREYTHLPITSPEDWARLPLLDPRQGALGNQFTALRLIEKALGPDVPVIFTIFSPIGQARKMAGTETFLYHLRRYPDALHTGLKIIQESTLRFIEALKATGIAGLFYAVQHGQYGTLSEAEFAAFGRAYDLPLLEAAKAWWLNVLHLHGSHVMFEQVADYPAQVINWHDRETWPSLATGQRLFPGAVCGGLRQWETMVLGTPAQVQAEAREALEMTGGRRFILGTGCVTPITAPHGNLLAARHGGER